jgi:hypothetical protein
MKWKISLARSAVVRKGGHALRIVAYANPKHAKWRLLAVYGEQVVQDIRFESLNELQARARVIALQWREMVQAWDARVVKGSEDPRPSVVYDPVTALDLLLDAVILEKSVRNELLVRGILSKELVRALLWLRTKVDVGPELDMSRLST